MSLSAASGKQVTVDYADAGTGTATAGTDYTALGSGTLTFAAGETSKTVTVSVTGDETDEANETVVVALSGAVNAALGTASGTGTITDDDGEPSLSIDSPSVGEGDSGSVSLEFTVSLSAASGKQVTVGYAEGTGGTATAGTDYTALGSGTLTFAAGETGKTVTVSVTGDTTDEANETVVVALSGAVNAALGTASGTGTITDDDGEPSLSIDSPSVGEGDSGSVSLAFTVSLSAASGKQVTVGYAEGTGTATAGDRLHGAGLGDAHVRGGRDRQDAHGVGDRRHDGRGERDGGGGVERGSERGPGDGERDGDDHRRRRRAVAVHRLAARHGGRQRHGELGVHGESERGERQAGDGGLCGRGDGHGGGGDGLHGGGVGNAHVRGGRDQQDGHGVGDGR